MNKQQTKIIGAMLACALAFSGYVLVKDRAPAENHEEAEHHEEKAHVDDGIVRFSEAQIASSGITVLVAEARQIDSFIRMPGQIALNEDRTAHVTPRASGAVEKVEANLGEIV